MLFLPALASAGGSSAWPPLNGKRRWSRILRLFWLSAKNFEKNNNSLKASALTFLSALSFVPIIGVLFGVSHGFGLDIKGQILSFLEGQEMIMERAFEYAENLLGRTRSDLITGIGILVLFYTVMRLLHNIENIFNSIWNTKNHRSLQRKFSDYTAIVLTSPLLIFFSSSLTVFIATEVIALSHHFHFLGIFSFLAHFLLKLLPYTLIWMLFTLFYVIMPNTRVNIRSAAVAGVLSGTAFQVLQWAYIHFQVGVSQYNAVYGSLAALPLFLIWMHISWMIILFGAEFSFSHQYLSGHTYAPMVSSLSFQEKKIVSLWVLSHMVCAFREGKKPLALSALARAVHVSAGATELLLEELRHMGLVVEVALPDPHSEKVYQPGMDVQNITPRLLFSKLEETNSTGLFDRRMDPWVREFSRISTFLTTEKSVLEKPLPEILKGIEPR